jgi:SAM-dependent methyltransferase
LVWRGLIARAFIFNVDRQRTTRPFPFIGTTLYYFSSHISWRRIVRTMSANTPPNSGAESVERVDFDQYAGRYEAILTAQTNFFDGDSNYFARYKIELARELAGNATAVLDFGCGIGRSMPHLRAVFPKADIVGCDPSAESLAIARNDNPVCRFVSMEDLGPDAKFDLVIASCVFHHIPPQDRQTAIRYCQSRLMDGGRFIIFEHNPLNPVTRHMVNTCPFDTDAILLGMSETADRMRNARLEIDQLGYCLFFPQQLSAFRPFEKYLRWLPLGGQYFVCAENPKPTLPRAA